MFWQGESAKDGMVGWFVMATTSTAPGWGLHLWLRRSEVWSRVQEGLTFGGLVNGKELLAGAGGYLEKENLNCCSIGGSFGCCGVRVNC